MEPSLSHNRGFTLVELMVVLAIITIITGIMMTSQGSFNKTLVLSNTAYDVALTFRFAETFGLGSRVYGSSGNTGYGLHFGNSPSTYTLFADAYPVVGLTGHDSTSCHPAPSYDATGPSAQPGNCVYEAGLGEKVQDYTLGNRITIANFCAQSAGAWICSAPSNSSCPSTGAAGGLTSLDIVFSRPNPTPSMSTNGSYLSSPPVTSACIALTSSQGGCKYISVGLSGQVSMNATSCP